MTKQRKINYKIYHHDNEVIAVSTFAKRMVRGVAKCDPRDEFDHKKGEALAIARCDLKVAEKRMRQANEKAEFYREYLTEVTNAFADSLAYQKVAKEELDAAKATLKKLETSM